MSLEDTSQLKRNSTQMSFGSLSSHSSNLLTPETECCSTNTFRKQFSTQLMQRYTDIILIKTKANISCLPRSSMMLETVPKSFNSTLSGRIIAKSSTGGSS